MKIKVFVSIPAFITEVETDEVPGLDTDDQRQAYARNVALERAVDNMRQANFWFDGEDMVSHILPGE